MISAWSILQLEAEIGIRCLFEAGSHRLWIFRKSKSLCGRINRDCKEVEVHRLCSRPAVELWAVAFAVLITVCRCSLLHEQTQLQGRTLPGLLLANRGECRGCTAAAGAQAASGAGWGSTMQRMGNEAEGTAALWIARLVSRAGQVGEELITHFVSFQALEQAVNRRRSSPGAWKWTDDLLQATLTISRFSQTCHKEWWGGCANQLPNCTLLPLHW